MGGDLSGWVVKRSKALAGYSSNGVASDGRAYAVIVGFGTVGTVGCRACGDSEGPQDIAHELSCP